MTGRSLVLSTDDLSGDFFSFFFCGSQRIDDSNTSQVSEENPLTLSHCCSVMSVIMCADALMTNRLGEGGWGCGGGGDCVAQIKISCTHMNRLIHSKTKARQKSCLEGKSWPAARQNPQHASSSSHVRTGQSRNAGYSLLINQAQGSSECKEKDVGPPLQGYKNKTKPQYSASSNLVSFNFYFTQLNSTPKMSFACVSLKSKPYLGQHTYFTNQFSPMKPWGIFVGSPKPPENIESSTFLDLFKRKKKKRKKKKRKIKQFLTHSSWGKKGGGRKHCMAVSTFCHHKDNKQKG